VQHSTKASAEVREFSSVRLEEPTVMAGFVGAGLVGPLAVGHIVESMGFAEFACMRSRHIPPAAVFLRGHLQHPFRLYAHEGTNTCAIVCEITLPVEGIHDIVSATFDWLASRGASELVVLDGIAGEAHDGRAYYAAERDTHHAEAVPGISMITRGYIAGISGGLLDECLLHDVRGSALLVRANRDAADPGAAATLVNAVNSLYGTRVDASPLLKDAGEIEDTYSELSRRYARHRGEARGMYM